MAQYDGSIRINTKIDSKEASSQLMTLENRIVKTADKVASLRSKMDALKDAKIPTQEYSDAAKEVEKLQKSLGDAYTRKERFLETGGDESSRAFKAMEYDIEKLEIKLRQAEGDLKDIVYSGKAFTLGRDTEEFARLGQQLEYAKNDMAVLNRRHDELIAKQKKTSDGYKKISKTAKESFSKINKSVKKTGSFLSSMIERFKGLALSLLIFNQVSKAFDAVADAIKEGFSNLYDEASEETFGISVNDLAESLYNDRSMETFKSSVDNLKSSLLTLENSFAAAFLPLVNIVMPYIQKAIEYITILMDKFGQFMAVISGQKTYTKAIKQTADAFNDAEKSADGYLSPLDEINKFQKKDSENQEADAMFKEVPVDTKILDFVQKIKDLLQPAIEYAQKLKDVFTQGFFDGLGDWEYRWESIKDSISSIKESLSDIFTDPNVIGAADKWIQSVAYVLGSFAGSVASIGLTIATNLLGGISKYLEENKDRIKGFLISMFDIWSEINQNFAEFFQSVAYVFEAFASENGQQLTANIIGIFSNAFMGIQELASRAFRDISNIIIQPFVDNKEGFRTALEGFLGVLSEVTETIKQGIDETFDKLIEVYDAHFKPMFDSIAQGLSDIVGKFLEFWNETVQPILEEWAQKFDVLWKEHIQPFLNQVADLLGSIADLIKALWESVLKPLIEWIIQNVLPEIMPISGSIYETVVNVIGSIMDIFSGLLEMLRGVIDFLVGVFTGDWQKAFDGITSIVTGAMNAIGGIVKLKMSVIGGTVNRVLSAAKAVFQTALNGIASLVKTIFSAIKNTITSIMSNVKSANERSLSAVKNAWNNVLNGIKTAVQNVFGNILRTITSVIDTIKNAFSAVANWFGGLFGGGTASVSASVGVSALPVSNPALAALNESPIPRLATGAVIPANREFLAVLGDQKHGTNVEAPLDTIRQASEEAVLNVLSRLGINGNTGNSNQQPIIVKLIADGKELTDLVIKNGQVRQMSSGNNPFMLGTT